MVYSGALPRSSLLTLSVVFSASQTSPGSWALLSMRKTQWDLPLSTALPEQSKVS